MTEDPVPWTGVRWGPGGPPVVDVEWAEISELVMAGFAEVTARLFDHVFIHTEVPEALARPVAVTLAPKYADPAAFRTLLAQGDDVCSECGWEVGHAWTCSRAG